MEELQLVREITGRKRGRVFSYVPYLDVLQQGMEPLQFVVNGPYRFRFVHSIAPRKPLAPPIVRKRATSLRSTAWTVMPIPPATVQATERRETMGPNPAERRSTTPGTLRFASRLVAIVLILGAGGCATTGSIQGTLTVPRSNVSGAKAKAARSAPTINHATIRDAVAFVVDDRGTKPPPTGPSRRQRMRQTSAGFEPSVIAVPAGTTVEFENRDRIYHNAFSVAKAKRFDTGLYAPGQRRPVLFARPGVVNVYCELHPRSAGFVVVLPNRLYARPNAQGEFRLPPLAEGTYTVKAWHPIYGETSKRVKVPRKGNAIVRLAF